LKKEFAVLRPLQRTRQLLRYEHVNSLQTKQRSWSGKKCVFSDLGPVRQIQFCCQLEHSDRILQGDVQGDGQFAAALRLGSPPKAWTRKIMNWVQEQLSLPILMRFDTLDAKISVDCAVIPCYSRQETQSENWFIWEINEPVTHQKRGSGLYILILLYFAMIYKYEYNGRRIVWDARWKLHGRSLSFPTPIAI